MNQARAAFRLAPGASQESRHPCRGAAGRRNVGGSSLATQRGKMTRPAALQPAGNSGASAQSVGWGRTSRCHFLSVSTIGVRQTDSHARKRSHASGREVVSAPSGDDLKTTTLVAASRTRCVRGAWDRNTAVFGVSAKARVAAITASRSVVFLLPTQATAIGTGCRRPEFNQPCAAVHSLKRYGTFFAISFARVRASRAGTPFALFQRFCSRGFARGVRHTRFTQTGRGLRTDGAGRLSHRGSMQIVRATARREAVRQRTALARAPLPSRLRARRAAADDGAGARTIHRTGPRTASASHAA